MNLESQQPLSFWWTDVVIPKETIELQQCDEPPWSSGTFLTQTSLVINAQYYIEVEPVNRTSSSQEKSMLFSFG